MSIESYLLKDFKKSIKGLEEILDLKKTAIIRDSAIKRFEICFDLAWKASKFYVRNQGIECYSPRSCFKAAFQLKLIEHDERWLKMIDDRNLAAHLYKEKFADKIYLRLPDYLELFKKLFSSIGAASR